MRALIEAVWYCGFCGEENTAVVDTSAGRNQSYTEDCEVCCHPNLLRISVYPDSEDAAIQAEYEG